VKLLLPLAVVFGWCACAHAGSGEGGFQERLRERGVDLHAGYISQAATNVQGGDRQMWRYADEWTFSASLDLEKLLGLDAALLQMTLTDRNGRNLSVDANLDSLQEVQGIYGRGQTWHWTQFFYGQKYLDGHLDWKIGRLFGGEDFASFPCEFMNLALCGPPPGNIAVNAWYNWPVSQWATRLRASFKGFGYVQLGVFEANPEYLLTRRGLDLGSPSSASGVLVPLEVAWQPVFDGRYAGSYKFGAWYNSRRATDVGERRTHRGSHGAYVNFLQRLTPSATGDANRGVSGFLNATFVDRDTATLDSQIALGAFIAGPFASRPADQLGLAVGRTHANSRVAAVVRRKSEYVAEVFYRLQIVSWLDLRPTAQYVRNPGGLAQNEDDVVLGLRISANL